MENKSTKEALKKLRDLADMLEDCAEEIYEAVLYDKKIISEVLPI